MSNTGTGKFARLSPNAAGRNSGQVTCLANRGDPGCTRSDAKGVKPKRAEPSHEKAEPKRAKDLRSRAKLGYKRSRDGNANPKREQLKHNSGSPNQAAALNSIRDPGRVAAKIGGDGLN